MFFVPSDFPKKLASKIIYFDVLVSYFLSLQEKLVWYTFCGHINGF